MQCIINSCVHKHTHTHTISHIYIKKTLTFSVVSNVQLRKVVHTSYSQDRSAADLCGMGSCGGGGGCSSCFCGGGGCR